MSRHEAPSSRFIDRAKERGTKLIAAGTLITIGALGLAGCASNAEAKPSPSVTVSSEAPSAAPTSSSEQPTTSPSPSAGEMSTNPSGLKVDYNSFNNWDNKPESLTPVAVYGMENSKEWTCDQFFMANGLPGNKEVTPTSGWDAKQITEWMSPRLNMVYSLYVDKTNPQNKQVAEDVLECLTSEHYTLDAPISYDARHALLSDLDTSDHYGTASFFKDLSHITRHTDGVWTNGKYNQYDVEYAIPDGLGGTSYPVFEYEFTPKNDYRITGIFSGSGNPGDVIWGSKPPVVVDPSRTNAPYTLR
jgi:hypothetical protein